MEIMTRPQISISLVAICCAALLTLGTATAQQPSPDPLTIRRIDPLFVTPLNRVPQPIQSDISALLTLLRAHEMRIAELEQKLEQLSATEATANAPAPGNNTGASHGTGTATGVTLAAIVSSVSVSAMPAAEASTQIPSPSAMPPVAMASSLEAAGPVPSPVAPTGEPAMAMAAGNPTAQSMDAPDPHDHMLNMPGGGPTLKIRGFYDFNYGVGSIANPLIYPVSDDACGTCGNPSTPAHTGFQSGEFDLFLSSKLSNHVSFVGEIVMGPDNTNVFGLDIERYQLTYKANRYFSVSAGRFHTSIGYYNTAYHHGNWFSTAEGRPIMYLFEDSGGILPVHMVGLTLSGEVPHTEGLGLHWTAELGNGNSSNPFASNSVQNFYSDRNYKATNLAFYAKPEFLPGVQLGGSWYHDGLNPTQAENPLSVAEIRQSIESAYIVYFSSNWEFMNEGVMLSNHLTGSFAPYRSPMAYSQIARKFGIYKPYFRYQYVRDNVNDPINILKGTYYGPSVGMRVDLFEYAAVKLQFNHLYQSSQLAGNGLDAQLAFTF